jgi:hypothetical protein
LCISSLSKKSIEFIAEPSVVNTSLKCNTVLPLILLPLAFS